ncbi:MAG: hypothetical protein ACI9KN_001312 [Gammaproteobacteria bacterium]|jgi:hypothetical protein
MRNLIVDEISIALAQLGSCHLSDVTEVVPSAPG